MLIPTPKALRWLRMLLGTLFFSGLGGCYDYTLTDRIGSDEDSETKADTVTQTETKTSDADTSATDVDCQNGAETAGKAGITWITICGGQFDMGSATEDDVDEQPVHSVSVPRFEMLESEVTVAQYRACVEAVSCTIPLTGGPHENWNKAERDNHPVNNVNWNQAAEFCAWAGGRLPSEAEWEYAASNGDAEDEYPWGNQQATCGYAIMDDGGDGCGMGGTWDVCSRPDGKTSHGLCDMGGNVWEWVQDWYHTRYTGAPTDGSAWEDPAGTTRVYRGGAYYNLAGGLRAANRMDEVPTFNADFLGLRCAR